MEVACDDIAVESCQAGSGTPEAFPPHRLAQVNITSDMDEVLWPDPAETHDAEAEWKNVTEM